MHLYNYCDNRIISIGVYDKHKYDRPIRREPLKRTDTNIHTDRQTNRLVQFDYLAEADLAVGQRGQLTPLARFGEQSGLF